METNSDWNSDCGINCCSDWNHTVGTDCYSDHDWSIDSFYPVHGCRTGHHSLCRGGGHQSLCRAGHYHGHVDNLNPYLKNLYGNFHSGRDFRRCCLRGCRCQSLFDHDYPYLLLEFCYPGSDLTYFLSSRYDLRSESFPWIHCYPDCLCRWWWENDRFYLSYRKTKSSAWTYLPG